jgi:signal transduction histidine kinase
MQACTMAASLPATRAMPSTSAAGRPGPTSSCITHPLELFPPARRWRRSVPRDVLYTGVWNTLVAGFFTLMAAVFDPAASVAGTFRATFVIAQCIGFVIHALFALGERLFPRVDAQPMAVRFTYYTGVPLIGVLGGYPLAAELLGWNGFLAWLLTPRALVSMTLLTMAMSSLLLAGFVQRERAARAEAAVARDQARVSAAERAATFAQLRLLEAQVEPHFLYNTLAHVMSLIDDDPRNARRMLERLIDLLRATAATTGHGGTLGEQVDWLQDYLEILALRMGPRLAFGIEVPTELRRAAVPPMLLQPLVENAIRHGLEPRLEGGRVDIHASRDGARLRVAVRDTGAGFAATRPAGRQSLGLANVRARLAALHGDAATLTIEDNAPCGTIVTLELPLAFEASGAAGSAPASVAPRAATA